MTFLAVVVSKFLADSPLTTIFHFHAPLYFPIPVRSRSRSNKTPQAELFLWYFRCYWMQHQQEISWERLSLHSFQAPLWKPKRFGGNKQPIGILQLGWINLLLPAFLVQSLPLQGVQASWRCWAQGRLWLAHNSLNLPFCAVMWNEGTCRPAALSLPKMSSPCLRIAASASTRLVMVICRKEGVPLPLQPACVCSRRIPSLPRD